MLREDRMPDLEYSAQKDMMARQALPQAVKRLRGRALEGNAPRPIPAIGKSSRWTVKPAST